jgi:ribosomal protein S18 acetylase RimI-like enzyme
VTARWRPARPDEDDAVIEMCLEFYCESPGLDPIASERVRTTLDVLRAEPWRGVVAVLDIDGVVAGYALLTSYWSNEFGGELCEVDELFVAPDRRGQGHGRALFDAIERGGIWPATAVGIALGVTPENTRARRLYEELGFEIFGISLVRRRC